MTVVGGGAGAAAGGAAAAAGAGATGATAAGFAGATSGGGVPADCASAGADKPHTTAIVETMLGNTAENRRGEPLMFVRRRSDIVRLSNRVVERVGKIMVTSSRWL